MMHNYLSYTSRVQEKLSFQVFYNSIMFYSITLNNKKQQVNSKGALQCLLLITYSMSDDVGLSASAGSGIVQSGSARISHNTLTATA